MDQAKSSGVRDLSLESKKRGSKALIIVSSADINKIPTVLFFLLFKSAPMRRRLSASGVIPS